MLTLSHCGANLAGNSCAQLTCLSACAIEIGSWGTGISQMQIARILFVAFAAASLAGCGASLPGMSTGSLFGGGAKVAPTTVDRNNDPVERTMDVAATSARAIKCGYNFDPTKLKNDFLTSQTAANPADASKLTQIYDASFNTVSKAIAANADYCSASRTTKIKLALNRHLAGDYTPSPPEPKGDDGSLLGSWKSSSPEGHGADMKAVFE
jgi:hypothetical protein